jgi:hypothetical protein
MTDTVTGVKTCQGYAAGKWCNVATLGSAGIVKITPRIAESGHQSDARAATVRLLRMFGFA